MEGQSRDNWINESMGTLAGLEEQQQDLEDDLSSTRDPARRREIEAEISRLDKEIRQLYAAVESVVKGMKAAAADAEAVEDEDDDFAETAVFDREHYSDMIQELLEEGSTTQGKAPRAKPSASVTRGAKPTEPAEAPVAEPTTTAPAGPAQSVTREPSTTASQSLSISKIQMRALAQSYRTKQMVTIALGAGVGLFILWIIWLAS